MSDWPPTQPIPAEPLTYSAASYGRAPGLITTIGVFSISIAGIGLIFSLLAGVITFGLSMSVRASSMRALAVQGSAVAEELDSEDEIAPSKRKIIIDSLAQLQPLSPLRKRHLDQLLKAEGKTVIAIPQSMITPDSVRRSVSKSFGQVSSGSLNARTIYAFGNGVLTVSDKEATFEPLQGDTLHASADPEVSQDDTNALANAAIARIEALSGAKFNAAQREALSRKLAEPDQTLLVGGKNTSVAQINYPNVQADGSIGFYANNDDWVYISPSGNLTINHVNSTSSTRSRISETTVLVGATIDTLVSMGLAVYLLVAGILMLRLSPRGRMLHWIYVAVKTPLMLASVAFWAWQLSQSNMMSSGVVAACVILSAGLIYPLSLIFVLSTRTVRDYYRAPANVAV